MITKWILNQLGFIEYADVKNKIDKECVVIEQKISLIYETYYFSSQNLTGDALNELIAQTKQNVDNLRETKKELIILLQNLS